METFYQILGAIGALLIAFVLYQYIKGRPEQLSKENLSKSFYIMGILALIMIAFVGLLVLMVRNT